MKSRNRGKFPTPKEFLRSEKNTLKRLQAMQKVHDCYSLKRGIDQALPSLENRKNGKGYDFHCEIDIKDDRNLRKRDACVAVGAVVRISDRGEYESVSYTLCVILRDVGAGNNDCKKYCFANNRAKPRIIRRFHFDYSPTKHDDRPTFHLQYGGKPDGSVKGYHYCLEGWLETPRIFFPPMSLALVLDLVIHEYHTELGKELLATSEWRKMVKESEETVLKSYFERCNEYFHVSSTSKESHSFIHWHYGWS